MLLTRKVRQAFRGQVDARAALLETGRRGWVALRRHYERLANSSLKKETAARLGPEFAGMTAADLLSHFQNRSSPGFFSGFRSAANTIAGLQEEYFPAETRALVESAHYIVSAHRWPLLGYGEIACGEKIEWLRDPVSDVHWPLEYYADLSLVHSDGGDVRVLWELNRLGHLITLARADVLTGNESFAEEFFAQVESWNNQNPAGFGPNWSCAMEVALRAMNLLAAFQSFRSSSNLTDERLRMMLTLFDRHGEYIERHLEFSFIATSNHYLTDVVGLLWLGIGLPELQRGRAWREFGLRELLREMEKQILSDGSDYESSTGYHRYVLELFLYSFILCQANSIEIADKYWQKLRLMIAYLRAYLRPDGRAPLIGDTDSGQVLPITHRRADDHGYLLGIGAVVFDEPKFKIDQRPVEELLWLLGEEGLEAYRRLDTAGIRAASSAGFADAGTYVLRHDDLYLFFNASGAGINGRGSHAHNDALSIEVSACGTSFLSDPGTYVYTSDLAQRHLFRSTGYHSTVEVDGVEQNTTEANLPFRIGNEAQPEILKWETDEARDFIAAEHYGYQRLANGRITHRRAITFDKRGRYWLIEDTLTGSGAHEFKFIFHFASELEIKNGEGRFVAARDGRTGASLIIASLDLIEQATLERRWYAPDYGARVPTEAACFALRAEAPLLVRWVLLPICLKESEDKRLELIAQLTDRAIGNRQSAI